MTGEPLYREKSLWKHRRKMAYPHQVVTWYNEGGMQLLWRPAERMKWFQPLSSAAHTALCLPHLLSGTSLFLTAPHLGSFFLVWLKLTFGHTPRVAPVPEPERVLPNGRSAHALSE